MVPWIAHCWTLIWMGSEVCGTLIWTLELAHKPGAQGDRQPSLTQLSVNSQGSVNGELG